jgi:hypothetical protein
MMRAVIPAIAVLVVLFLGTGLVLLLTAPTGHLGVRHSAQPGPGRCEQLWNAACRWLAKREARAHAKIPWTKYSMVDPRTGDYLIGIRKVAHGEVVEQEQIQQVPAGDLASRVYWESVAFNRALECNEESGS